MSIMYIYAATGILACLLLLHFWRARSPQKKREASYDDLSIFWQSQKLDILSHQLTEGNACISEAAGRLAKAVTKLQGESSVMKTSLGGLPEREQAILISQLESIDRSCDKLILHAKKLESVGRRRSVAETTDK